MIFMAVALFAGVTALFRHLDLASFGSGRIGLVYLDGTILDSTSVVDWIQTLRDDDSVKGVILRVNSRAGPSPPPRRSIRP